MSENNEKINFFTNSNSIFSSEQNKDCQEENNNSFQNKNLLTEKIENGNSDLQFQSLISNQTLTFPKTHLDLIFEETAKSYLEKKRETEIFNSENNKNEKIIEDLKIENENLKKEKEEIDLQLSEKLNENCELHSKITKYANELASLKGENIKINSEKELKINKLKEENNKMKEELEKKNFIIKQLENEKLQNLNKHNEEIENIKNQFEELVKEKKCLLDLYTNLQIEFGETKKELNSENLKLNEEIERLKKQAIEQSAEDGFKQLKLSAENNKLQAEKEQLIKKMEDFEFELTEYKIKNEEIKESIKELNNQIISMDKLIKINEKELEEEKNNVKELNILNKNIEMKFNEIKAERIKLATENAKLNTKLENQSKGLQKFRSLEEQNKTLNYELEKIRDELKKAQETYFQLIMQFFYQIFSRF
ncbi:hypothetical protein ACQ4LE_009755 [Meloidogyne hapla]